MQPSLSFSLSFCFLCCHYSLSLCRSVSYAAITLFLSVVLFPNAAITLFLSVVLFPMLPLLFFSLSFCFLCCHHSLSLCLSVSYAAITFFRSVFMFPMLQLLSISLSFCFLCCHHSLSLCHSVAYASQHSLSLCHRKQKDRAEFPIQREE